MKAYAIKHKDLNVRMESRSGGVFTAISDYVLERNGVVYGCYLDENQYVRHGRFENSKGRDLCRKSKYVQSDKQNTFRQIKKDLQEKRFVLFSGTTCEVAGVKSYLESVDCSRLILVDILCHGVPSPLLWEKYKEYCEKKMGRKIKSADFRNKKMFGWASNNETITFQDDTQYHSRDFACIFYSHYGLRPSCYHCPYKSINHPTDFTLADCWGIDKDIPTFNDNKGVSLLLVNSPKAQDIFVYIKRELDYKEVDIRKYMQLPFRKPCSVNQRRRKVFWKNVETKSFEDIVSKYGNNSVEERIKRIINSVCTPTLRHGLKRLLGR